MTIRSNINVVGQVTVRRYTDGELVEKRVIPNLVVTAGREYIAGRMKETGRPSEMSHMAVGSGTTAESLGQTALVTEITRIALTTAGGTVSNNKVTYNATFAAGVGTGAITEFGIFNAASDGTMLCRTVDAVINKGADDTLAVEWEVTIVDPAP